MKNVILQLPDWLTTSSTTVKTLNRNHSDTGTSSKRTKVKILFFITGNPGLIGYYDEFLALLAQENRGRECIIAGASLGGFDIKTGDVDGEGGAVSGLTEHTSRETRRALEQNLLLPNGWQEKKIYDLRDQIDLSYRRLVGLIEGLREMYDDIREAVFEVILAGHSVGAYIALELVRLHHEKRLSVPKSAATSFNVLATLLLTPTIHNISQSSSGRLASPVLHYIPFFPTIVQLGALGLSTTLPKSWLRSVVQRVTGMQNASAIDVTTEFLCTRGAVEQALYLAACEMREIGEDEWTNEVWGLVGDSVAADEASVRDHWVAPKHFFLFAKEDHWIANVTRDAIMTKTRERAVVLVDADRKLGIDHAWCLQQSDIVAGIVNRWMDQVFEYPE